MRQASVFAPRRFVGVPAVLGGNDGSGSIGLPAKLMVGFRVVARIGDDNPDLATTQGLKLEQTWNTLCFPRRTPCGFNSDLIHRVKPSSSRLVLIGVVRNAG